MTIAALIPLFVGVGVTFIGMIIGSIYLTKNKIPHQGSMDLEYAKQHGHYTTAYLVNCERRRSLERIINGRRRHSYSGFIWWNCVYQYNVNGRTYTFKTRKEGAEPPSKEKTIYYYANNPGKQVNQTYGGPQRTGVGIAIVIISVLVILGLVVVNSISNLLTNTLPSIRDQYSQSNSYSYSYNYEYPVTPDKQDQ